MLRRALDDVVSTNENSPVKISLKVKDPDGKTKSSKIRSYFSFPMPLPRKPIPFPFAVALCPCHWVSKVLSAGKKSQIRIDQAKDNERRNSTKTYPGLKTKNLGGS